MAEKAERSASGTLYFLLGLGLGSLLTILFAPQSGDETRAYVSRKARDASDYAQRKAQEFQERAGNLVEQGKKTVRTKREQISAAVDAGRQAYKREFMKERARDID